MTEPAQEFSSKQQWEQTGTHLLHPRVIRELHYDVSHHRQRHPSVLHALIVAVVSAVCVGVAVHSNVR